MPRRASCAAVARENASCACFDAAYGPDGGDGDGARDRDDVDDVATARAASRPGQERAQAPDAAEVVRRASPPRSASGRASKKLARAGDAGVVDEQLRSAGCRSSTRAAVALDRLAVGDVADLVLAAELLRERAQPLLAPREQHAVPAARGEPRARSPRRSRTRRR